MAGKWRTIPVAHKGVNAKGEETTTITYRMVARTRHCPVKTPTTPADHTALGRAQAKRERRASRRLACSSR